jgi:hypothetical protein
MFVSKSDFISRPCGGSMPTKEKNSEPEVLTDAVASESTLHLPLKIISIKWTHKDDTRKKESPDTVIEGDIIELSAELENCIEGAGADFLLYGKASGKETALQEIHTRCKDQKAIAEWTVDLSKVDIKNPSLQFELEASDKRSKRCKISVGNQSEDRYIIFEETAERIDPDFPYELCKAEPAKNRWVYVFGSEDGMSFSKSWEIKTDTTGKKFSTFEIDESSYDSRSADLPYEDVAILPLKATSGKQFQFIACISDIRIPKDRIFGKKNEILLAPLKHCYNIDDPKQAVKKVIDQLEEKIVLLNILKAAEVVRKRFDETLAKWEEIRRASWYETTEEKKKEKLLYEFGAVIALIISNYPDYKQHLGIGQYPKLVEQIEAFEDEKKFATTELTTRLDSLCRIILNEKFTETCIDYTFLIQAGDDQPKDLYTFEDRIGAIVEGIARFPQGLDTLKKLFPVVKNIEDQTWAQNILLLNNDIWSSGSEQLLHDPKPGLSDEKKFQNCRKLCDGLVKLLVEGAKSGAGVYKPEVLIGIIQKVIKTSGQSVLLGIQQQSMSSQGVKPFQKVFGSLDKNSFWRIKFEDKTSGKGITGVLKSDTLKNLLLGLEGLALLYSLKDFTENVNNGKAGKLDSVNITAKLLTYFVKSEMIKASYQGEMVKLGGGPIAVLNVVTSAIDLRQAFLIGKEEFRSFDADAAACNFIAAAGYATAVVGYTALAATFFAGAAVTSSTIIGIAPGTLLAFVGALIAIGGKTLAAGADNTPLEDMLLRTPWGTNPENNRTLGNITSNELRQHYLTTIRIINAFQVEIDHDTMTAVLHLRRLEPETIVTIHEVAFGIPISADGSKSDIQVVGTNIKLSDINCVVVHNNAKNSADLQIDLRKICPAAESFLDKWSVYYASFGKHSRPDYIKIVISVDVEGDGKMLLPDVNKRVRAEKHYGSSVKIEIN